MFYVRVILVLQEQIKRTSHLDKSSLVVPARCWEGAMGIKEGARLVVPCKALLCAQLVASFLHCNFLQSCCCSVFTVGEIIKGFTSRADYGNCSDKWHLLPWVAITALAADTGTAGQSEGSIPDCFEAHRLCFNVSFFQKKGTGAVNLSRSKSAS